MTPEVANVALDLAQSVSSNTFGTSRVIFANFKLVIEESCQSSNPQNLLLLNSKDKSSSSSESDPKNLRPSGKSCVKYPKVSNTLKNKLVRKSLKPSVHELLDVLTKIKRTGKKKCPQNKRYKKRKRCLRNLRKARSRGKCGSPSQHVYALPPTSEVLSLSHNTPTNQAAVTPISLAAATDVFSDHFSPPNGDNLNKTVGSFKFNVSNNELISDTILDKDESSRGWADSADDHDSHRDHEMTLCASSSPDRDLSQSRPFWLFSMVLNLSLILLAIPLIPSLLSSSSRKLKYILGFNSEDYNGAGKANSPLPRLRRRRSCKIDVHTRPNNSSNRSSRLQGMSCPTLHASYGVLMACSSFDKVNNLSFVSSRHPRTCFLWWRDAYS